VLLIPGILLALISAHLFIMFHQKHTQMPGKGNTEKNVNGQPFYPYFMAKGGAWFFFIFGALVLLSTFAEINPIWLYGPTRRWPSRPPPSPTSTWASWRARCASCPPGRSTSSGTRCRSACSYRSRCR
jgi:Cytochrome b subunit of the bc complex